MLKEFKELAMRGNLVDMAVGITVGVAFVKIANSLVSDILMPPIGLLLGKVDFSNLYAIIKEGAQLGPYPTLALARASGAVTINYGIFIDAIINFLIIAFTMFLIVRSINRLKKKEEAAPANTKECPFCLSAIPIGASKCSHCTTELAKARA